jgi:murein DD-endopeptidase MepM/ murein hydrolase activator NlpD
MRHQQSSNCLLPCRDRPSRFRRSTTGPRDILRGEIGKGCLDPLEGGAPDRLGSAGGGMSTNPWAWGGSVLPTVRLSVRTPTRSLQIVLTPVAQALGLAGAVLAAATICYLAIRCMGDQWRSTQGRAAELRMERANIDLQDALASLQDRLGAATRERAQIRERLAALAREAAGLRGNLDTAEGKLRSFAATQDEISQQVAGIKQQPSVSGDAVPSTGGTLAQLTRTLSRLRGQLHAARAERDTLMARLDEVEAGAKAVQEEGRQAANERDRLHARVNALEQALALRSTPAHTVASEPEPGALGRVERVLASTGLDLRRLLSSLGAARDEGGPFVLPPKGGRPPNQLDARQLLGLQRLAKALPIAVPLGGHYRLTSPFGIRSDPFNGRAAFHPGVDLAAPFGAPVYATAPGVVTYVGWYSGYGKLVEIDHGHGIATWYGHLTRYTVLTGEHVRAGTQIGYEGSTGRSTGPHVIYEVLVNGQPQDPEKFFALARLIPAAAH